MKNIILYILLLIFFKVQCQNNSITYEKKILITNEKQNVQKVQNINSELSKITYTLKFSENKSTFKMDDFLEADNSKKRNTALRIGGGAGLYIIEKGKSFHNTEYFGENYLVDFTNEYKNLVWKLSKQSRVIQGFKCYLATTERTIENPKGFFTQKISAWYSPQLNYSYGPIGYYGLPGIILNLLIDNTQYEAISVNFNTSKRKSEKTKLLPNSKLITYTEFVDISRNIYLNMIKNN